jgi:hypothetical protein
MEEEPILQIRNANVTPRYVHNKPFITTEVKAEVGIRI